MTSIFDTTTFDGDDGFDGGPATEPKDIYVIVGAWSSTCSACGGNADRHETAHIHGGPSGYMTPGSAISDTNGCRAVYTREPVDAYIRMGQA